MGWMDKAKKLAEQAQEKLDEAQKNFNKSDAPDSASEPVVRHDEHGRPIQEEETPAAATAPPSAAPPSAAPKTEEPEEAAPPPPPSAGGANTSPDPFKPIQ